MLLAFSCPCSSDKGKFKLRLKFGREKKKVKTLLLYIISSHRQLFETAGQSNESKMSGKCFFCCKDCENTCENCQLAFCSSKHFEVHKQNGKCSPWFVEIKPGIGRTVLATRDIQPFELVMRDTDLLGMVMMDAKACVDCGERKG